MRFLVIFNLSFLVKRHVLRYVSSSIEPIESFSLYFHVKPWKRPDTYIMESTYNQYISGKFYDVPLYKVASGTFCDPNYAINFQP